MIAIATKFHGPTNSVGSRVSATAQHAGSNGRPARVTLHWDHRHGVTENHKAAAMALAQRQGWHGRWIAGSTDAGFVFVRTLGVFGSPDDFEVTEKPAE